MQKRAGIDVCEALCHPFPLVDCVFQDMKKSAGPAAERTSFSVWDHPFPSFLSY